MPVSTVQVYTFSHLFVIVYSIIEIKTRSTHYVYCLLPISALSINAMMNNQDNQQSNLEVAQCNKIDVDVTDHQKLISSGVESIKLADVVSPGKVEDSVLSHQVQHSTTPMEFFLNYDIPDKCWWTPDYIQNVITVEANVKYYAEYKARIKVAYADANNKTFFDGYLNCHQNRYLLETLTGEGNIDGKTTVADLEEYTRKPDGSKVSNKINNLINAMDELFPNIFEFVNSRSKIAVEKFTPEFIQQLHKLVTIDLVEEPGVYRKTWAKPSQDDWIYLVPEKIPKNLKKLCELVRDELRKEELCQGTQEENLVGRIKIVATFLTEFLQIHPFTNGNGRVARLLISWLMTDLSIVPVPLLTISTSRDRYLQCLRDARYTTPILPTNLARLIMESVIHTMRLVCLSLDI